MNLHTFLADLQRGTSDQFRREMELHNLQRFAERQASPVPSVEEQVRTAEQLRGGAK